VAFFSNLPLLLLVAHERKEANVLRPLNRAAHLALMIGS
jgi:hypothetical protein